MCTLPKKRKTINRITPLKYFGHEQAIMFHFLMISPNLVGFFKCLKLVLVTQIYFRILVFDSEHLSNQMSSREELMSEKKLAKVIYIFLFLKHLFVFHPECQPFSILQNSMCMKTFLLQKNILFFIRKPYQVAILLLSFLLSSSSPHYLQHLKYRIWQLISSIHQITMEETILTSPNNDGRILKLQIKQKNAHIRKRKVKTWTPDQDQNLIKLYEEYPKKWGVIANLMNDRNQNQCLHRYRRLSQLGAHKKIWSVEEDHAIINLIKKVGKNWKVLSQMIGTKTGKQIRERFINKLDPKIKTEEWTDEEDRLILRFYSEVGSRWSEISKRLPGRPQNKIKNRFYSYIQKNYDIKYSYIDPNYPNERCQKKQQWKQLKEIGLNESIEKGGMSRRVPLGKQNNESYRQIPSIKEIEGAQNRNNEEQKDEIFDSNINIGNKFYLKSLIRVDEELGSIECKYRSIRDIISNNELENQNDLFYMEQ